MLQRLRARGQIAQLIVTPFHGTSTIFVRAPVVKSLNHILQEITDFSDLLRDYHQGIGGSDEAVQRNARE
jgi:hypothetical protein